MPLTEDQQKQAEWEYIIRRLTPDEVLSHRVVRHAKEKFDEAKAAFEKAQSACLHPLIARETENRGSTGNWDRDDSYWTHHHCRLCGLRWITGQRWEHVGGKRGMPDDEEAKES